MHQIDRDPLSRVRSEVSEEEWRARVDLAACYRLIAAFGMSDLIYNHATVRIPGTADHLLINPYGYMYEEITASSLIRIDLDGRVVYNPHGGYDINYADTSCTAPCMRRARTPTASSIPTAVPAWPYPPSNAGCCP